MCDVFVVGALIFELTLHVESGSFRSFTCGFSTGSLHMTSHPYPETGMKLISGLYICSLLALQKLLLQKHGWRHTSSESILTAQVAKSGPLHTAAHGFHRTFSRTCDNLTETRLPLMKEVLWRLRDLQVDCSVDCNPHNQGHCLAERPSCQH